MAYTEPPEQEEETQNIAVFMLIETPEELSRLDLAAWKLNEKINGYDYYVMQCFTKFEGEAPGHYGVIAELNQKTREQISIASPEELTAIMTADTEAEIDTVIEQVIENLDARREV